MNRWRLRRGQRRRCGELRKQIDEIERRLLAPGLTPEQRVEREHDVLNETRFLQEDLLWLETILEMEPLQDRAERLGVEIPPDWRHDTYVVQRAYRAPLRRRISDARLDYWKKRVEVLVPILSLLVALAAILTSAKCWP